MATTIDQAKKNAVPKWFWFISIVGLLWFTMDASAFYMRVFMAESSMANMPQSQQLLYRNIPSWVNMVFALEVFGGLFGCIGLLLGKNWAFPLFIISMIGVVCQSLYVWFLSDAINVIGMVAVLMPLLAVVIGIVMIVFSKLSIARGWLR